MTLGPLLTEVVVTFCLAAGLLYKYGNWLKHHIIVTVAVLVAWYFSFLIIFVLPLDVSSTVYRQCMQGNHSEDSPRGQHLLHANSTTVQVGLENASLSNENTSTITPVHCEEPWSNVPENIFPNLWRVVYWTSQCLTWLVLPLMQSYIKAGDFTVRGKLKSALIDNAIYYGSYLFICGVLLIYIALKPGHDLDGQKLKAIASSASNTWGLFLLVLLLGYALVEVPRSLWNSSKRGYVLNYTYFKAAKLSSEKCEAEETVDDILESLQAVSVSVGPGHPLHRNLETILQKVPPELRERMSRQNVPDDTPTDTPSDKALVRLHKQVIKALQTQHRTETQWSLLVDHIVMLEDVARNQVSHDRRYKPTFQPQRPFWLRIVYNSTVEWYWKCVLHGYALKVAAILSGLLSAAVVWSEVTFFNKDPVLSLFAQFLSLAKVNYDYFTIEVLSTIIIAYMCYCAYSTVLKIRLLNLYYLAPHHQTDEYSLVFSGMMLCRLTPPMCLNFLGLIHMDSHIIKRHISETHYTQVMGHMDVISIVSDGFNVYFPMAMLAFGLATYFSLGSRLLSLLGFQQFVGDDEVTAAASEELEDVECKVVLVGDSRCGKTALIQRFVGDNFVEVYSPTGFEKYACTYTVGDYRIHFVVWDTSGTGAYDNVRPLAYQDAKVFLLCFRVSDPDSLDNAVSKWHPEIQTHCDTTPVILCGCQSDLRNDIETISNLAKQRRIPVTSEQAVTVSRQVGAMTYVETSAKTSSKAVKDAFEVAALAALGKLNKNHSVLQRQRAYTHQKSKLDLKAELKGRAKSCSIM